ncbi:MAG: signal peptidase I [Ignavibacteria bacterium]|nr:signal peptidase I [Ignavibacteria bacterium]
MGETTGLGMLMAMVVVFFIPIVAYLFIGFCLGKVFEKAGKPLWAGFIPVYNLILLLEIVGRPIWWAAFYLIPILGWIFVPIITVILCIDLAKSFGKDTLWGVLTAFFGIVMIPIMAFSKDIQYVGPSVAPQGAAGGGSMGA